MSKKILIFCSLFPVVAPADLVITEAMPKSSHSADKDWWELTNTGSESVNLEGYYWDDDGESGDDGANLPSIDIAPGESVIIIEGSKADFQTMWMTTGLQLIDEDDVTGPDEFSGLSSGGETLDLWDKDPNNNEDAVLIDSVTFAAATAGVSFEWDSQGTALGLSSLGQNDAVMAGDDGEGNSGSDIGSPGNFVEAGSLVSPSFQPPLVATWRMGLDLVNSAFRVQATDPNAGEVISFTIANQPAWLGLNDLGSGLAALTGTPPDKGSFNFELTIQDDSNTTDPVTETFILHVFGDNNVVLMNEYNAVDPNEFIDGDDGEGSDTFFNRVEGNGGDWFELVVVGPGDTANSPVTPQAGTTVDMRGWSIQITTSLIPQTIKLSQDDYWAAVPAGTLLTFTQNTTAEGGLDTAINKTSKLDSDGYLWSNIHLLDPFFIDQENSTTEGKMAINSSNTQFVVFNAADIPIFGPSGEGVLTIDTDMDGFPDDSPSVNSKEVYKLEQNPTPAIDAMFASYDDGTSSSFGSPNVGSAGAFVQDFSPYSVNNTPPSFTSGPVLSPSEGAYSYTVTLSETATVTAGALPSFLELDGLVLKSSRALTAADNGSYPIELLADDGEENFNATPQKFILVIGTAYDVWLAGFDGTDGEDSDLDGSDSLEEYLFGGSPIDGSSFPQPEIAGRSFMIDLRNDDLTFTIVAEWSSDLMGWSDEDLIEGEVEASSFGDSYSLHSYTYEGELKGRIFFRARPLLVE
jgi:hypothetical protein